MLIVIPYREGVHKGVELKYALRSINKYLKGYTDVIIVGRPPEWYQGRYIIEGDVQFRKQYTIYKKLITAIETYKLTGDFILWNDDHFLLSYLNISHIKFWHSGKLLEETNRDISARVYQALQNTLSIFPDGNNFDVHTPIIYNATKFLGVLGDRTDELYVKSFYCNSYKIEGEYIEDCKINGWLEKSQIEEHIKGKLFFSTGENGIKTPMILLLEELYPEKSQWEK